MLIQRSPAAVAPVRLTFGDPPLSIDLSQSQLRSIAEGKDVLDAKGETQGRTQEGEPRPELKNSWFIRCSSGEKFKPKVFDRRRNPIYDVTEAPSGSRVLGVVNAYAWENPKNGKGISFGVSIVQVVHKAVGEEILGGGGGPDPDKFLEKLDDEGEAPASTKSGAGAGGLFG